MNVHKLLMLASLGIALGLGVAHAQEPGAAAPAGDAAAQVEAPTRPGLLGTDADQARSDFNKELRSVEEQVDGLKERVFRSKATLEMLEELVVDGAVGGSRLVLWHINRLGGGYALEGVQYFLDGKSVFSRNEGTQRAGGGLDDAREFKVLEQAVTPGDHELQVVLMLRGQGYRLFSYLREYQFQVQSSFDFDVEPGVTQVIRATAASRGGLRSYDQRPTVRYDLRTESLRED